MCDHLMQAYRVNMNFLWHISEYSQISEYVASDWIISATAGCSVNNRSKNTALFL